MFVCFNVDEIDIEFLVIIIIFVVFVGDSIVGLFDCDCNIWFGKVIWGITVLIDKLFELLFFDKVCWEIVSLEGGDRVDDRFVFMFEIIVMWIRGLIFLFCELIWCICIIGECGSWLLFKVWVIVVGFESKLYKRKIEFFLVLNLGLILIIF